MSTQSSNPPRGFRDLSPKDVSKRDRVLGIIALAYERRGYRRIETPCLENIERLRSGVGGENETLIFEVLRRGLPSEVPAGTARETLIDLGLRYDLTVPLSRFVAANLSRLPLPFRSFQVGPVWRAERPQSGRFRQFTQCDIDLIGEPSVLAEIELIEATTEALAALGIEGMTVRISDRRILSALAVRAGIPTESRSTFFVTLDKLDKVGWEGVRAELAEKGIDPTSAKKAEELVLALSGVSSDGVAGTLVRALPDLAEAVVTDLSTTLSSLEALADRDVRVAFDPTLVRGMGYYTGQIFEIGIEGSTSSIAGGGRYDELIGRFAKKQIPACGFSIGFERIIDLASEAPAPERLALLFEPEVPLARVLTLAARLRSEGRSVVTVRRSGKLKAQLDRLAEDDNTSWALLTPDSPADAPLDERPIERSSTRGE